MNFASFQLKPWFTLGSLPDSEHEGRNRTEGNGVGESVFKCA